MRQETAKVTLRAVRKLIEDTNLGVDHEDVKDTLLELILCLDRNQIAYDNELETSWKAFLIHWKETQATIKRFIEENDY